MTKDDTIVLIGKVIYTVIKEYNDFFNEETLGYELNKKSIESGIVEAVKGLSPEKLHALWMETKVADGWVYGKIKDLLKKTHPCMIPHKDLPERQRVKDTIFYTLSKELDALFSKLHKIKE